MRNSQTLYSLRTDGPAYRITKFTDGDVESTYLTDGITCECPAGPRPSCRHRQMLPTMLAAGIANTHWFMDWDRHGAIVDFNGASKRLYDQLAAAAEIGNIKPNSPNPPNPPTPQDTAPPSNKPGWRRI